LALVVLNIVHESVDLPSSGRRFVILVAIAAAVLTNNVDDPEPNENPTNALEDERQSQK
jgi:hypothetical protein